MKRNSQKIFALSPKTPRYPKKRPVIPKKRPVIRYPKKRSVIPKNLISRRRFMILQSHQTFTCREFLFSGIESYFGAMSKTFDKKILKVAIT